MDNNVPNHLVHFDFAAGSAVDVKANLSIDDLLGNVNRAAYYRYNGSLTTPSCNEAVVWTVFEESVKVDQNLVCAIASSEMLMWLHITDYVKGLKWNHDIKIIALESWLGTRKEMNLWLRNIVNNINSKQTLQAKESHLFH